MTAKTAAAILLGLLLLTSCSNSDQPMFSDFIPPAPLLASYPLSSTDSIPEGVAFDPVDRAFYASSLQGGSITKVDADGTESTFRAADNRALLLGMKVDASARRLWVCARAVDGIDNRVWVFDLDTGNQTMEFLLGALATNGSCNDLALDDNGLAYVTDSSLPNIYLLDPASETGSLFLNDPLLADDFGVGLGLNGIAVSADQSTLLVGKFAPAQLIAVSLPNASTVGLVALDGDTLPSPDGLVFIDDDLYAVSDSSISRILLNIDRTQGSVTNVAQISGLSTATVAEGQLYAIKSEVVNFVTGQALNTPFEIFAVDLGAFE